MEKIVELDLPEGKFAVKVEEFEEKDRKHLFSIYQNWRSLCDEIKKFSPNTRAINTPEALSESAFCLEMGFLRVPTGINGAKRSFDCYDPKNKERIQLKACGTKRDTTTFGPKSVWDKIYFVDFYRKGKWDGQFDIYHIDNEDIYLQNVNSHQKFTDQQKEKRRPRFSIKKKIIEKKGLKPIKTGDIRV